MYAYQLLYMNVDFEQKIALLQQQHEALLQRSNLPVEETNGIVCRYTYPIVTREHIPLEWRYDFNPATNPYCMERIGFNATMNSGAIKWNGKYVLVVRVEGADRKSFFAVAERAGAHKPPLRERAVNTVDRGRADHRQREERE